MTSIGLRWGVSTDVGRVRAANQDSAMANGRLFVVADGMGGHQGGEVASAVTIDHFLEVQAVSSVEGLTELVGESNRLIRQRAADEQLEGMGTTVVALAVISDSNDDMQLACVNVGDSRMYRLEETELVQLTLDHSLVAELARAGQITEEEAARHPQRNVLTRALGVDNEVGVDHWVFPAVIGHRYLLCSDGLFNEVSNAEIANTLRSVADPTEAADTLVELANEGGGRDNTTVLIVDLVAGDDAHASQH